MGEKKVTAKVRAISVLSCALSPVAVLTATFPKGRVGERPAYVLLRPEERDALSRMHKLNGNKDDCDENRQFWASESAPHTPDVLEPRWFDSETGEFWEGRHPFDRGRERRASFWYNAGDLWVRADLTRTVSTSASPGRNWAVDLWNAWATKNPEQAKDECRAPSWLAYTAVRKLLLAAGLPDIRSAS